MLVYFDLLVFFLNAPFLALASTPCFVDMSPELPNIFLYLSSFSFQVFLCIVCFLMFSPLIHKFGASCPQQTLHVSAGQSLPLHLFLPVRRLEAERALCEQS